MPVRMTMRFNAPHAGWSETLYRQTELTDLTPGVWDFLLSAWIATRSLLLHPSIEWFDSRVSDVNNSRRVYTFPYRNRNGDFVLNPDQDPNVDYPFVRLLTKYNLVNGGTARNYLGGLPDEVTASVVPQVLSPRFLNAFADYSAFLTDNQFCGYVGTVALNPNRDLLGFQVVGGLIHVEIGDTTGILDGERMRITRAITEPDLNGIWKVKVLDGTHLVLVGSTTTLPTVSWEPGTGIIKTQRREISRIGTVEQVRVTKHNAGRRFGEPRGRTRRRRRQVPRTLMVS